MKPGPNGPILGDNLILATDSYKLSHWRMYPPGTTRIGSYFESRGGEFEETVFFGLQPLLDQIAGPVVHQRHIDKAAEFCSQHFGSDRIFNREGWQYILREHRGYLPVRIRAVPEGSVIPTRNVLMTVENTDPNS